MSHPLILASSSRYRRELLERLGVPFETTSPDIDESSLPGETPRETALRLSLLKVREVQKSRPDAVIIGSDQVADLDGEKLGKPHTRERSIAQLERMQGKTIVFTTALTVVGPDDFVETVESRTLVKMRKLSRETIEAYVDREQPFDCAGSAKIEKLGIALMEEVSSDDPTSLIGLPLMLVTTLLSKAGVEVLPGLE